MPPDTSDSPDAHHASPAAPHAVSRLRTARIARSAKPFLARGGPRLARCSGCRMVLSHCLCGLCSPQPTRAGVCLLMADTEPLKPSNTGWLIADAVADTFAFGWARTAVDPELLALLTDPQWQPYLVFPADRAAPERVVADLAAAPRPGAPGSTAPERRPLFVILDATWSEASRMFRKSPYLDRLPVLGLQPERLSRYRLRQAALQEQVCTCEVAALCLALAGDTQAAQVLTAYLDVFTHHYLQAKDQRPVDRSDALHRQLQTLVRPAP